MIAPTSEIERGELRTLPQSCFDRTSNRDEILAACWLKVAWVIYFFMSNFITLAVSRGMF